MARPTLQNVSQSMLSEAVEEAATTIYVVDEDAFSSTNETPPFCVIVDAGTEDAEIMLVTAVNDTSGALTVERDMLGTTDVAHAKRATVTKYGTPCQIGIKLEDVSTAETVTSWMPKCVVTRFSTCLGGTIATADTKITMSKNTQAITNGEITVAYDGSAAGDIDVVYPTVYTEFNGTTDYLSIAGGGQSTNDFPIVVMCECIV